MDYTSLSAHQKEQVSSLIGQLEAWLGDCENKGIEPKILRAVLMFVFDRYINPQKYKKMELSA